MDPLGLDGDDNKKMKRRSVGRGRGRGSWTPMSQNTQEHQMLRRPRYTGTENHISSSQSRETKPDEFLNDIVKNSTLSADAAEFIPKGLSTPTVMQSMQPSPSTWVRHSVQNRIQLAREFPDQLPNQSHHQQRQIVQAPYQERSYDSPQSFQQQHHGEAQYRQFDAFSQQYQVNQHANNQTFAHYEEGAGDYANQHWVSDRDNRQLDLASTMQQLLNIMHSLTLNPGCFSSLIPALINNIKLHHVVPSHLREIMEAIIEQSINEGNFRYSGARVCTCLDTAVMNNEQTSFREILFSLCQEKTQKQAFLWQQKSNHNEDEQKICHGLILFLAELVAQMEDTPAFKLGELLVRLITAVLEKPAPNSAKHICQALKLAGQTLEKDKRGSRRGMENMMRALTELVTEGRADSNVGRMVDSVHQLRNGNWGRNISLNVSTHDSSSIESTQSDRMPNTVNEPVFYGPDGNILSAEESQFLQDATQDAVDLEDMAEFEREFDDLSKDDDDNDVDDDDDDDDELIAAAYEEFLKLMPNNIDNKVRR